MMNSDRCTVPDVLCRYELQILKNTMFSDLKSGYSTCILQV